MQRAAVAYQEIGGRRVPVEVKYRVAGTDVGFEVGEYDHTQPLVIDPILSYSTYFGAIGLDSARGIAADAAGNAYVVGVAQFADLPGPVVRPHTPLHPGSTSGDDRDAYVAKFRPDGSVEWTQLFGGTDWEIGRHAVAVGPDGDIYVGGDTHSRTFPRPPAPSIPTSRIQEDEFLLRLAPDGTTLRYSTVARSAEQPVERQPRALAVDAAGRAYVAGATGSNVFPGTIPGTAAERTRAEHRQRRRLRRPASAADGARLDWSRLFGGSLKTAPRLSPSINTAASMSSARRARSDFTVLNALYPHALRSPSDGEDCSPDGFLTYVWNDGSLGFLDLSGGTGERFDDLRRAGPLRPGVCRRHERQARRSTAMSQAVDRTKAASSTRSRRTATRCVGTRYVGGNGESQMNALVVHARPELVLGARHDGWGRMVLWLWRLSECAGPGAPRRRGRLFLQKWDALRMEHAGIQRHATAAAGHDNADGHRPSTRSATSSSPATRARRNFPLKNAAQRP